MTHKLKLYLGTGQLGRIGDPLKKKKQLEIIQKKTKFEAGIHISPTYGKSFNYLKGIDLKKFSHPPIVKIDFSDVSHPIFQLQLVQRLLKNSFYQVQIAGDLRNNSDYNLSPQKFLDKLYYLKNHFNILGFYLTIYFHDKIESLHTLLSSNIFFGVAIHHSLVELEAHNKVIKKIKQLNKNIISLRVFGESLNNYGNWFSEYCSEEKPKSILDDQIKNLDKLLFKYNINSAEARLIYAMNNDISDIAIITLSNEDQVFELTRIFEKKFQNSLIKDLIKYNLNFTNKNRRGFGFRYPANKLYFINHSLINLFNYCIKFKEFSLFFSILIKKPMYLFKSLIRRIISNES